MSGAPNFGYARIVTRVRNSSLQGLDVSSWRCSMNGAEPVLPSTLQAFAAKLQPFGLAPHVIQPAYGVPDIVAPLGVPVLMTGREGARLWKVPTTYHRAPDLSNRPARLFIQIMY